MFQTNCVQNCIGLSSTPFLSYSSGLGNVMPPVRFPGPLGSASFCLGGVPTSSFFLLFWGLCENHPLMPAFSKSLVNPFLGFLVGNPCIATVLWEHLPL